MRLLNEKEINSADITLEVLIMISRLLSTYKLPGEKFSPNILRKFIINQRRGNNDETTI